MAKAPWQPIVGRNLYEQGAVFGPLAAPLAIGATILSAGMTVLGGISQSQGMQAQADAQQRAGQVAVMNAQLRQKQLEAQAKQKESEALQNRAAANDEAAKGQRVMIENKRKGRLMAGRARAVMAASGAGVDESMTAGLLAEGDYAGDVALFEGDQRSRTYKNAAHVNDYEAAGLRYMGEGALWQGEQTRAAYDMAAGNTRRAADAKLWGSVASAGLSLASKYGGDFAGGDSVFVSDRTAKSKWFDSLERSPAVNGGSVY